MSQTGGNLTRPAWSKSARHPTVSGWSSKSLFNKCVSCYVVSDCDFTDYSPPGSSVHGILQARILEWAAVPSPGRLPNPGIKTGSPTWQADSLPSEPSGNPLVGRLPNPGIKTGSPTWQADSLPSEPSGNPLVGRLPNPGIKTGSPTWQADSLPSEPSGNPLVYQTVTCFHVSFM